MADLRGPEPQPNFMGISTFAHAPFALTQDELKSMNPDVAIIGAPVDMGVVNRPGARFGPRAIRQAGYSGSPNERLYHMGLDVYPMRELKVLQALHANALPIVLGGSLHNTSQRHCRSSTPRLRQGRYGPLRRPRRCRRHSLWRSARLPRQPHATTAGKRGHSRQKLRAGRAERLLARAGALRLNEGKGHALAPDGGDRGIRVRGRINPDHQRSSGRPRVHLSISGHRCAQLCLCPRHRHS